MRLIDGVKADFYTFQEIHVLRLLKALRGQVQQFRLSSQHIFLHGVDLAAAQAGVDEMRHAFLLRVVPHRIHLVLHQRNQRTNHDCHAVHQQRWQLVA